MSTAVLSPFSLAQLRELTGSYADDVRAGQYPIVDFDPDERWHRRIYRDSRVDVWLISWLPAQGTQLHDHGGSSGSFAVVSGELSEAVAVRGHHGIRLHERTHTPGRPVGFGPQYVHDVRNLSDAPAVSVHAYSPPLTSMSFYDVAGSALHWVAGLDTNDPEPTVDPSLLAVAS